MANWTELATLASPIVGVVAIFIALYIAQRSSKDAQKQINAIRHQLDVFIAANNLNIVEAQRKYQQQLAELNAEIEDAQETLEFVGPFPVGARIDYELNKQQRAEKEARLQLLLDKRKELQENLFLIQDYIDKTTTR